MLLRGCALLSVDSIGCAGEGPDRGPARSGLDLDAAVRAPGAGEWRTRHHTSLRRRTI
mgnify:CR=1 FL=1